MLHADETRYECHRCGCHFESPNPLKIHLSLDCGRQPLSRLWSRLLLAPPPPAALLGGGAGGESAFRPYAPSDTLHRQVEALASNLGKAARGSGHLCIYCGKVYSRKYGLKIHIRYGFITRSTPQSAKPKPGMLKSLYLKRHCINYNSDTSLFLLKPACKFKRNYIIKIVL